MTEEWKNTHMRACTHFASHDLLLHLGSLSASFIKRKWGNAFIFNLTSCDTSCFSLHQWGMRHVHTGCVTWQLRFTSCPWPISPTERQRVFSSLLLDEWIRQHSHCITPIITMPCFLVSNSVLTVSFVAFIVSTLFVFRRLSMMSACSHFCASPTVSSSSLHQDVTFAFTSQTPIWLVICLSHIIFA